MKKIFIIPILLGAAMGALAQEPRLSAGMADIIKLSQASAGPAVIESFINNSPIAYSPTSDEIIYLRKQGVSDQVLAALLRHGAEIRQQANAASMAPPYQPQQQQQQAWPAAGGQVPMPGSPAPNVGSGPDYPTAPAVDPVPAYTYNDGYYWGPGYWGWNGGAYLWIGPGWRWGGWGGGWGRGYAGWGYGGWGRGLAGWHGGYGYGGGHFGGGFHGGVGHAGGGGGHAGGGHGGGGHR